MILIKKEKKEQLLRQLVNLGKACSVELKKDIY
jgi:hypothetical protein